MIDATTIYLREGTTLQAGKYKIFRFISSGGFGCTYEAEHVMLHKKVAIKEFFVKDFCNRDEQTLQVTVGITAKSALVDKLKQKFVQEAQSLCSLEHSNIVHVFDVFEENGTAYYVMDYIDGPSLNDLVKRDGHISEQKAVDYIRQVADALKYVHSHNRLHLDIKPGNIMIDEKGKAVLIDFGASKQYDEESGENTSTLLGQTPGYAPLEQMGNDIGKFSPATDIYALGATLYKLVTGITPPSASILATEDALYIPSSLSAPTRNAIVQAMQINKAKRPQTIDDFFKLLNAPLKDVPKEVAPIISKGDDEETVLFPSSSSIPDDVAESISEGREEQDPNRSESSMASWLKISSVVAIVAFALGLWYFSSKDHADSGVEIADTTLTSSRDTVPALQRENVTNKIFEDKNGVSFTYTGEVVDGAPNGKGTGIYPYGKYTGEYQKGLRQGQGKFESKDGTNKFEGTFDNDSYAEGTLRSAGMTYKGTFINEQPYNGTWYDVNNQVYATVKKGQNIQ